MFQTKLKHAGRVSFATKLFPKLRSTLGLETSKIKSLDGQQFDGELFCGGRSKNRDLLTFFGFISPTGGVSAFAQLPTFRRSVKKLTNLVEQELQTIGAQEILMPTIVPRNLWLKSKRIERQQSALDHVYQLTDNENNKLLLGPTFEETVTKLVAESDIINESELPLLLYQSSPKFRSEPNSRFGLLRANEFLMNDMYSFDANPEQAAETYEAVIEVYDKIFKKLGLKCVKTQSVTGSIGGKYSHEYQLAVSSGEDTLIECNNCQQACNRELYLEKQMNEEICLNCGSSNLIKSRALELGHTFLLSDTYSDPLKAKYSASGGKGRVNFEMGCYGLGLTRILGAGIDLFSIVPSDESVDKVVQLRWPNLVEPYRVGIVTPAKRSKQFHGGSTEFVERLVSKILDSTREIDLIIEDRDKEGISRRLVRLQSLGVPYIIVIGQRFNQDQPEVEVLELESNKRNYKQSWLTEDQVCDFIRRLEN